MEHRRNRLHNDPDVKLHLGLEEVGEIRWMKNDVVVNHCPVSLVDILGLWSISTVLVYDGGKILQKS